MKPSADFEIGGGWGNSIGWLDTKQFQKQFDDESIFRVYGFKSGRKLPEVGSTILGEFERSWIVFEVVSIEWMRDPTDEFFADVKPIEQVLKSASSASTNSGQLAIALIERLDRYERDHTRHEWLLFLSDLVAEWRSATGKQ